LDTLNGRENYFEQPRIRATGSRRI
jgi:hypothetical protein